MAKKQGGGRRKYTMSPAALAQRRGAAWKHGGRAATVLRRSVPPCKPSTCPLNYPCDTKRALDEQARALEACPVALTVDPEIRAAYLKALEEGDLSALRELQATTMAGLHGLRDSELAQLLAEGLRIEAEVYNKDGDVIGTTPKPNPRAEPFLKLNDQLGATAQQQAVTPKSRGDQEAQKALSHAEWILGFRRGLPAAPAGEGDD